MKRSKLNYWIDVVMGLAFVVSAVSGLVFLLPAGFLSNNQASVLGVSFRLWDLLHLWGSLAMIAGVGGHLLLHTKWIVAMTKKLFAPRKPAAVAGTAKSASTSTVGARATMVQRRRFLRLVGGVLGLSALAAGGAAFQGLQKVLGEDGGGSLGDAPLTVSGSAGAEAAAKSGISKGAADEVAPVEQLPVDEPASIETTPDLTATPVPTAVPTPVPPVEAVQELCVSCPHGLVNDPYPGRCRRYIDRDGDRICDLSVPEVCG